MQHRYEGKPESVGDRFQFAEGEIAFVQLPVANAFFDDFVYERFDFLRRSFSTLREALSIASARLTMALSFVCGFGPL